MSDLIDRVKAINETNTENIMRHMDSVQDGEINRIKRAVQRILAKFPAVDAVHLKHGKWVVWDEILAGIYHTVSECSECGFTTDKMFREEMPYCPHCGAKMDAERKEE